MWEWSSLFEVFNISGIDLPKVRLVKFYVGRSAQCLHLGPNEDEPQMRKLFTNRN